MMMIESYSYDIGEKLVVMMLESNGYDVAEHLERVLKGDA
jgi:methanogenic corrinoid protein MtbC1